MLQLWINWLLYLGLTKHPWTIHLRLWKAFNFYNILTFSYSYSLSFHLFLFLSFISLMFWMFWMSWMFWMYDILGISNLLRSYRSRLWKLSKLILIILTGCLGNFIWLFCIYGFLIVFLTGLEISIELYICLLHMIFNKMHLLRVRRIKIRIFSLLNINCLLWEVVGIEILKSNDRLWFIF